MFQPNRKKSTLAWTFHAPPGAIFSTHPLITNQFIRVKTMLNRKIIGKKRKISEVGKSSSDETGREPDRIAPTKTQSIAVKIVQSIRAVEPLYPGMFARAAVDFALKVDSKEIFQISENIVRVSRLQVD